MKSRTVLSAIFALVLVLSFTVSLSAQEEAYRNPALPVEERVEDLLGRMTIEEKIGQMTQIEKGSISFEETAELFLGSVLSGGGGSPEQNTPEAWLEMVHGYHEAALSTRLGIPLIYGIDAVHGHNNVYGATIFPHNIGLGATRNADLVRQIGEITAREMIATGILWDFAPVVAPVLDVRWGRSYEGYSENTELVTELGVAFIEGLQGAGLGTPGSALATAKHFIGDGATTWGTSAFGPQNMDRGVTELSEEELRERLLPPYIAALEAGAQIVMASFSSWGGLKMHAQQYLLTDVLKGELGFDGFIVSDWAGIDEIPGTYENAVITSINAGIDMNMVPYDARRFISTALAAVQSGAIPMERIDDAVRRILTVKFEMGLFENPFGDPALLATIGSDEHRAVAKQAVSESLVLLKNENEALPLTRDAGKILVAGQGADNIGRQSGGWTISWQGSSGDITPGTTILEGIQALAGADTEVVYSPSARFDPITDAAGNPAKADVGIFVFSETPYAEYEGDDGDLELVAGEVAAFRRVVENSEKVIVILVSGRPLVINDVLAQADAFVAAWLPGTEGQGVADVLFGDLPFTGRLSFSWMRSVDQLPFDHDAIPTEGCEAPLFPYDYGLTYENAESEWLELAATCTPEVVVDDTETADVAPVIEMGFLAPEGEIGQTYYAPFPVAITVDGEFADWAGVPRVTMAAAAGNPTVTFAAAADESFLYLVAAVADDNIISGEHGADYWNEDSVEFYLNGTGDLDLGSYQDGVFQITIPALNAGLPSEEAIIAGVRGETAEARTVTVATEEGYAVEIAVPFKSGVWDITPENGASLGFQVHLNGASETNRNTKLIWSIYDTGDQSYQNPSLFGQLIFYAVEQP